MRTTPFPGMSFRVSLLPSTVFPLIYMNINILYMIVNLIFEVVTSLSIFGKSFVRWSSTIYEKKFWPNFWYLDFCIPRCWPYPEHSQVAILVTLVGLRLTGRGLHPVRLNKLTRTEEFDSGSKLGCHDESPEPFQSTRYKNLGRGGERNRGVRGNLGGGIF